tara:strand:+ start:51 stop:374 length:324 start_codon:yes stop_codon:yes gene_type:complete
MTKCLEELPEWIDEFRWDQFKIHRKSMRKKLTDYAEYLLVEKLRKFREQGYDPNELIDHAILQGWQSVFIPHDMKKNKTRGAWGLDPDHQMQIALEELKKGKDVKLN